MLSTKEILNWFESCGKVVLRNNADLLQEVVAPRSIEVSDVSSISFLSIKFADRALEILESSNSKLVIIDEQLVEKIKGLSKDDIAFILSPNPKADLIEFCKHFLSFSKRNEESRIESSAIVSDDSKYGTCVNIGHNVIIEEQVLIGDFCTIGANTVIKKGTIIGDDVEIGACNVIGGTGFGYSKIDSNEYEQFPHYGIVILHDGVHVGNNTCIDRGSLSDTIIYEGVKIDNLVHIAHNVKIGKNSLIIAKSMIAGSVVIGESCWIAPGSCIRNAVRIGENVIVGLASTVTKDVAGNQVVMGNPAMPMEDFKTLRKAQKETIAKLKGGDL